MSVLQTDVDGGVVRLTLNRPDKRNALDTELLEALRTTLERLASDEGCRCIVLTGAGKAFCAGGDVNDMVGRRGRALATRQRLEWGLNAIALSMMEMEKPILAKVNGDAFGAGCNLALACDLLYADAAARFGQTFVRMGLIPDTGGTFSLPRRIGLHRAKELVFLGTSIDAHEAARLGLVNAALPSAELDAVVDDVARRLAAGPTRAIGMAKRALTRGLSSDLSAALEYEAYAQGVCFTTDDHAEGVDSFLGKREPTFRGR